MAISFCDFRLLGIGISHFRLPERMPRRYANGPASLPLCSAITRTLRHTSGSFSGIVIVASGTAVPFHEILSQIAPLQQVAPRLIP
jgi:hypothetical protein